MVSPPWSTWLCRQTRTALYHVPGGQALTGLIRSSRKRNLVRRRMWPRQAQPRRARSSPIGDPVAGPLEVVDAGQSRGDLVSSDALSVHESKN